MPMMGIPQLRQIPHRLQCRLLPLHPTSPRTLALRTTLTGLSLPPTQAHLRNLLSHPSLRMCLFPRNCHLLPTPTLMGDGCCPPTTPGSGDLMPPPYRCLSCLPTSPRTSPIGHDDSILTEIITHLMGPSSLPLTHVVLDDPFPTNPVDDPAATTRPLLPSDLQLPRGLALAQPTPSCLALPRHPVPLSSLALLAPSNLTPTP